MQQLGILHKKGYRAWVIARILGVSLETVRTIIGNVERVDVNKENLKYLKRCA